MRLNMEIISIKSRDNERLKHARRVRDGKVPDSIFIEGARLCSEAMSSNMQIEAVFVTKLFMESAWSDRSGSSLENVFLVSESLLESIADTNTPQGIVMLAVRPANRTEKAHKHESGLSLFLYQINNPSNLGSVIRTAEAAGIQRVLISNGSADPFSPKALRASMGSAFRVPIHADLELKDAIAAVKKHGTEIVAVDAKGNSIYSEDLKPKPTMFVFGSEAHGLPDEILKIADSVVSIPMNSPVESLNLAVSCGIVLYEARRQAGQDQ